MGKEAKTNAMRILDKNKIPYEMNTYTCDEFIDGCHIADQLGQPYERSFKTLVTVGKSKNYFVFAIPVDKELNLKAAARLPVRRMLNCPCQRYQCHHRLYPGRLYPHRYEEAVSDIYP